MDGWTDAVQDFLLSLKGVREPKTCQFYGCQLKQLVDWVHANDVPLVDFRLRHMRRYLAFRADGGASEATRRHDSVAAKVFLRFCFQEGYLTQDPLAGLVLPKAPKPFIRVPREAEVAQLLKAVRSRWDVRLTPTVRYIGRNVRQFHLHRDYAIVSGLIETGCRAGEMLGLHCSDFDAQRLQITIRRSKGDEPRVLPISRAWSEIVSGWLRVRPEGHTDLLFFTEYGLPITVTAFGKVFRRCQKVAGLNPFSLHSLRHYTLTVLARQNVLSAATIAGHKDLRVTMAYLHNDPEEIRKDHAAARPLQRLLGSQQMRTPRRRVV